MNLGILTMAALRLTLGVTSADCPRAVLLDGEEPRNVQDLIEALRARDISANDLDSVPARCSPSHARLHGRQAPYELVLDRPGQARRRWQVHSLALGAVLIESAMETSIVQSLVVPEPLDLGAVELSLLGELGSDDTGTLYAGSGLRAAYCQGFLCANLIGHFGLGSQPRRAGISRRAAAGLVGLSLKTAGEGWGISFGVAGGVHFQHSVAPAIPTSIPGWADSSVFAANEGRSEGLVWEAQFGVHHALAEHWAFEAMLSCDLLPGSEDSGGFLTSALMIRAGAGLRWSSE